MTTSRQQSALSMRRQRPAFTPRSSRASRRRIVSWALRSHSTPRLEQAIVRLVQTPGAIDPRVTAKGAEGFQVHRRTSRIAHRLAEAAAADGSEQRADRAEQAERNWSSARDSSRAARLVGSRRRRPYSAIHLSTCSAGALAPASARAEARALHGMPHELVQPRTSTVPAAPSTRRRWPVLIVWVAVRVPTTAGMPNSRDTTAG